MNIEIIFTQEDMVIIISKVQLRYLSKALPWQTLDYTVSEYTFPLVNPYGYVSILAYTLCIL